MARGACCRHERTYVDRGVLACRHAQLREAGWALSSPLHWAETAGHKGILELITDKGNQSSTGTTGQEQRPADNASITVAWRRSNVRRISCVATPRTGQNLPAGKIN